MIKRLELTDPNSCMSRAGDEEMTFVLLERDLAFPVTLRAWIEARVRYWKNGRQDPQILEAEAALKRVIEFQLDKLDKMAADADAGDDAAHLARVLEIRKEIENCRKEGLTLAG